MIYFLMTIILLCIILFAFYKFIDYLCNLVVHPNHKPLDESFKKEVTANSLDDFYNSFDMKNFRINSTLGYELNCSFKRNYDSNKCMVICHGITANSGCSIKYAKLFYDKGFSVFIYDHRNHGLSGGNFSSMGYYEKFDLKTCVDWVYETLGTDIKLGVLGESMGAGTVLQYCAIDDRVDFCVEDCGYSSVNDLLALRLKDTLKHDIPGILYLSNKLMQFKYKWCYEDASPIKYIKDLSLPILFIHGACDTYVPTNMVYELYEAKINGIKDLYVSEDSIHAASLITNPEKYSSVVSSFLEKINL